MLCPGQRTARSSCSGPPQYLFRLGFSPLPAAPSSTEDLHHRTERWETNMTLVLFQKKKVELGKIPEDCPISLSQCTATLEFHSCSFVDSWFPILILEHELAAPSTYCVHCSSGQSRYSEDKLFLPSMSLQICGETHITNIVSRS